MSIAASKTRVQLHALPWGAAPGFCLVLLASYLIWFRAGQLGATFGRNHNIVDFHAFYLAGKLASDGLIANAYKISTLLQAQWSMLGTVAFMPWTYPPPFNLLVAILAKLPIGLSYLLFVGATFGLYVLALLQLAPKNFSTLILVSFPSIIIMIICGQNGFLTASIIGFFAVLYLRSSLWAGAVLGLMIIKPHLAIGIAIWLLFRRDFGQLLIAGSVALALCAIATLILGPSVWTSFLGATAEAGESLRAGLYPLFRMTSVYAGLRSFNFPYWISMGAHLAVASSMVLIIILSAFRRQDPRIGLGIAIFGSLFISPYCYDYDTPLLAISLALLWRPTLSDSKVLPTLGIVLFTWLVGASGFISRPFISPNSYDAEPVSLGWIAMLGLSCFVLHVAYRALEPGHIEQRNK